VPIHPGLVLLFIAYAAVRPDTRDEPLFLGVHVRARPDEAGSARPKDSPGPARKSFRRL
jgi:hypothetical protein